MVRRWTSVIVCGGVALGLVGCGSDSSSKGGSTTSTVPTSGSLAPVFSVPIATVGPVDTTPLATVQTATTLHTTNSTSSGGVTSTVPGRVVTKPNDSVHIGDSGSGVKQIQTALAAKGYKVTVDGKFGNQTLTAVKAFQKKNSLKQDGVVGPATWNKLSGAASSATTTTVKGGTTTTT